MRLIIGASGSGKTYYAYRNCISESIKHPENKYIIIVPEQYSMQTQKDIVSLHPYHATENIDVLSFNRLAYRVFAELGIDNPETIDDIGKAMIIRKLASKNRESLGIWREQFHKTGFVSDMKSMISELYQYGISPEKLEESIYNKDVKLRNVLKNKLMDLLTLYKSFAEFIRDRYITNEELLDVLARYIEKSKLIRNAHIVLDGFTGFTPVQYRLIERFVKLASSLSCTVTMGADEDCIICRDAVCMHENIADKNYKQLWKQYAEDELFFMSKTLIVKLIQIADENSVPLEFIDLNQHFHINDIKPRFAKAPALDYLERHVLRYDRCDKKNVDDNIRIVGARNVDEEISYLSGEILRLVKEEGYRYRDIAVIAADMDGYADKISYSFRLNDIPEYVDQNLNIRDNVYVELIRSALDVIAENYSYESVMRFIRSPLLCSDIELIGNMDNYMLSCGIRGIKRMSKTWEYLPKYMQGVDLIKLNEFRAYIVELLSGLYKISRGGELSASSVAEEIRKLGETLDVENKLLEISEEFDSSQDVQRAREYSQVYAEIDSLLDKFENLLSGEMLSKRELSELIEAGLEEIRLGIIPARVDRVIVGDLRRTRLAAIKILFVLGANEGNIPRLKSARGVLSDREKESLKTMGIELSHTCKEDLFTQRYYVYMNFTKPSHRLYISYAGADMEAKALKPSYIVENICSLYHNLEAENAGRFVNSTYKARYRFIELLEDLRRGEFILGEGSDKELELRSLNSCLDVDRIKDAAFYRREDRGIGREAALALFGKELMGSVTRLESYVNCPYSHFIRYGLGIDIRPEYRFEALDIGNLVHGIIEQVFQKAGLGGINLANMQDNDRDGLVSECVSELLMSDEKGIYEDSARNEYIISRIESMAKRSVRVMSEQLKKGDFIPYGFELGFSYRDNLTSMRIELGDDEKLLLRGKIDRVDICELPDKVLVKIIDYKTGSMSWETDLTFYGRQIQLVTYMNAAMEVLRRRFPNKEIIPAGMLYMNIADNIIEGDISDKIAIDEAIIKSLRPSGLINTDLDIIKHMDRSIEGASDVIPVVLKSGEISEYRSSVASTERMQLLMDYVRNKSLHIGKDMLSGSIEVYPMYRKGISACDYCNYSSICKIERRSAGYNMLKKLSDKDVWEIIDGKQMD